MIKQSQLFEKYFYDFNVEVGTGNHFLFVSGAYSNCRISTSIINKEEGKTFPPRRKLTGKRFGFWVWQIMEWLNGKRY